ncbi:SurA N-terminal domain-containing protein [Coxiella endosymbiont of Amblyomma nuttalli]|uniref:SurA N-terminal domain-containing protein n=1 Tax=Coxiella endosymbiont of Amblyomma nuttalli TaxID=2749996 RepID=UPI001BA4D44C|nr:SurA N-terminal domain-containing protein [Coxiella endosymbiont of Amblyomma nuttalli]QTS83582.1 Chaperone SurA precursor [Coxiella endosymbiont of Amblyomma nuttalli]
MQEKLSFILIAFITACIFIQSTLLVASTITPDEQLLDQIVAVVNNEIITHSELIDAMRVIKQQFEQEHLPLPNEKIFKRQVLDQLIYQKLQLQLAKRNNINVTNKEVNTVIARIIVQNHFSRTILKQKIAREGMTYEQFCDQLKKQLIIAKLQHQTVNSDITVNKSDIVAFQKQYQKQCTSIEYHVATILVALPDSAIQDQINYTREKSILVLKQLHSGSSFEKSMKMYRGSVDLGWRTTNNLPQIFASIITKMKLNEIVGPIRAPNGFHIIKLIGKKKVKGSVTDQQAQQIIYQQKVGQALQKWLLQLRRTAYIRIY